jgi:hypothetical protein
MPSKRREPSKKVNRRQARRSVGPYANDPILKETVDNLNNLRILCLALHMKLHNAGRNTGDRNLDEKTSWAWAADVCESLAINTGSVRSSIIPHDHITDPVWPDPNPVNGATIDTYKWYILSWTRLESQLFGAMMTFYNLPTPKSAWTHAFIHDVLYEMSANGEDFIQAENSNGYKPAPIPIVGTPAPPQNQSTSPIVDSVQRLEFALHKLVQYHMQIATFIPAHLPKVVMRGRVAIFMK